MNKLCTVLLILSVLLLVHLCMKKDEECKTNIPKPVEKYYTVMSNPLAQQLPNISVNTNNAGYRENQLSDY